MSGYRWRLDVLPFQANFVDPRVAAAWSPQAVRITVQSPNGQTLRINTVRLHKNAASPKAAAGENPSGQNPGTPNAGGLNAGAMNAGR